MNRKEFVRQVCDLLRENNVRKPISIPKQVFHISDNDGNEKDFVIKKTDKSAIYTIDDVAAIVDACLCVVQDSLKRGEEIAFYGFGALGLHYRKPRRTKQIGTDEELIIKGRFVPKFTFGNSLRMCAKIYELSLGDNLPDDDAIPDEDWDDTGGDD